MHSQYYFELTLTLDTEKFRKLLNRAKYKSKEEYESYSDNDNFVDDTLASKGITVAYHDNSHKKKVKLTVNSNWILGDDAPDHDSIAKSLRKLNARISEYFKSKYSLNDFKLTQMGVILDIDVREQDKVPAYLKIFKKVGKVKGFSPSNDSRFDNDNCFCLEGNSNGITFLIYDLEKVVKDELIETESKPKKLKSIAKKPEGLLRAEVWLTKAKAIRDFTNEAVASEQIADLLKIRRKILLEIIPRVIPFGNFYKKNKAVEIIERKVTNRTLRRKMLRLLELVPDKKSLLLAQKALNYRRIDDVMDMFASIDVSPVTISKRHDFKKLKNLYIYME